MNPAKDRPFDKLICVSCGATARDISKYRGRFLRRHRRDNVCGNYARAHAIMDAESVGYMLPTEGGTRVNMS